MLSTIFVHKFLCWLVGQIFFVLFITFYFNILDLCFFSLDQMFGWILASFLFDLVYSHR